MRPWGVKRLFRFPFRTREDVRTDIADEFAFHLDMRRDELMRGGLDETEARARAAREFGDRAAGVRACAETGDRFERRRRIGQLAGELRQDVTLGLRLLGRNPGFATVAILTLALGIGANTAIYSVLDALLLRPLPYPEPHRLVQVSETLENGSPNSVSGGAFLDWRTHQTTFEAIALTGRVSYNLRGGGPPERLTGLEVSHEFLRVLGVQPLLGRGFMPEDDRPGGRNDVVLLTEELWRTRFGGDTAIVGRAITLDEVPRTVVGVLPEGAWVLKEDAFFVPAVLAPGTPRAARAPHWAAVFGRLAPDADVARADAELKSVKRRLDSEYPAFKRPWGVVVQPVTDVIGGLTRRPLLILLAAVSMVLLIACANVANLLLARACHRQQELAVRAALGAGNRRLVRQVLTENLVLAVVGGAAGIGVAHLSVDVLRRLTADVLPFTFSPELDLRVLTFSLAVTMATGLLFGLLPALRARRLALTGTLNDGGRSATAGGGHRTQSLLIVAEVALTVVLLTSAGLLLRSLGEAASTDPGFDPSRALAFDLSLPDATYASSARRLAFSTSLLERVRALPGVSAAGTGMAIPFSGGGYGEYFRLPGRTELRDMALGRMNFVSPGYLEALGTRVLAGRRLTEADNRGGGARVAVISEATARQFFRDGDAIGQTLVVASDSWQIVGVIADVVDRRLDAVRGAFAYVPQVFNTSQLSVVVRTPLDPESLIHAVRREIARLDPGVALANPRALDQAMTGSMTQRKVILALVGVFAATALALASIGLYGVMAYAVATRRRELGIRMALGAVRADVMRDVIGGGLRMTGMGLLVGLTGAIGAARLLASELYRVTSGDPLVLAGTTAIVVTVAVLACAIPAWRAGRFDPIAVLRNE